jgi:hypothetical protein
MADWIAPVRQTARFVRSRGHSRKINLLGVVPESRSSSRNTHGAPVPPSPVKGGGGGAAELRLRVLRSLPETHLQWLFGEIRVLCENYLRRWHVPAAEVTPDELISEIWQKLLGTVSLDRDETEEGITTLPPEWSINPDAPERDDRVAWLINEIGGSAAIAHRHEDLRRQRHGRFQHGRGRQTTQLGDEDGAIQITLDPDEPSTLEHADVHRVWRGLLITANLQFPKHDDVSMLLRVIDDVRDPLGRVVQPMADQKNDRFAKPPLFAPFVDW